MLAAVVVLLPGGSPPGRVPLAALAATSCLAGLCVGGARTAEMDGGALSAAPGPGSVTGYVTAVPARSRGRVRVQVESGRGKVLIDASEPVADLRIGEQVRAAGVLRPAPEWFSAYLRLHGISMVLKARSIEPTGKVRGGPRGILDAIRNRAERALSRSMGEPESALARGFVLGQDDGIDPATVEAFQRSGLAHILAVSGQNVILLCLLAMPIFAALGISHRARLIALLALIVVYVPLAGGGASIQRAGIMGAAGLAATAAGRPTHRPFALAAALAGTLALNPLSTTDVGWQLSFAAVIGISVFAGPLASVLRARSAPGAATAIVAEGAAVTIAATVATAPLMAAHFGRVSVSSLLANLLVLPAVAPSMWLGMISAVLGQAWSGLAVPFNLLNSLPLAYIARVAERLSAPGWAVVAVDPGGAAPVVAAYAAIAAASYPLLRLLGRRRRERQPAPPGSGSGRRLALAAAAAAVTIAAALGWSPFSAPGGVGPPPAGGIRIDVLDIGQGDSILIRSARGGSLLIDGGPPGDGLAGKLRAGGLDRLDAALVTHGDSDHSGGIIDLLGRFPIGRVIEGVPDRDVDAAARGAGVPIGRVSTGDRLSVGGDRIGPGVARLDVLWPPASMTRAELGGELNLGAVVCLLRWHRFRMLLTADAEAESVPVDPGPVDVLKVAHHGSDDAGLAGLLDRIRPGLAVISVGAGNEYGHPTPSTLRTLAAAGVPVLRTDLDGDVSLLLDRDGLRIETGR